MSLRLASTRPLAKFSLRWSLDEISRLPPPTPNEGLILHGLVMQDDDCSTIYRWEIAFRLTRIGMPLAESA